MKRAVPYLFILPLLLLTLLFYVVPAVSTVFIATTDMGRSLRGDFVGIRNFTRMFSMEDPVIGRVLVNTLVYLAISKRVIEGSPDNAISTVPIMPWGGK